MATATTTPRGINQDVTRCVGNTPLVRLRRVTEGCVATVAAKLENLNPLWSVKDRIGRAMIDAAERDGKINKDTVIIEPTSGNTGIGLAYVCAARGYKLMVTMPESMSLERRRMLKALGRGSGSDAGRRRHARRGPQGRGAGRAEQELLHAAAVQEPGQSGNPSQDHGRGNLARHRRPGRYLRQRRRHRRHDHRRGRSAQEAQAGREDGRRRAGQQPGDHADAKPGKALKPGRHTIQGIGAGFIPDVLNVDIIDDVVQVQDEDAMETARQLAKQEGLMCGISSRRRRLGRDPAGQAAGERRQADRRGAARPGRAILVDEAVSGMKQRSIQ